MKDMTSEEILTAANDIGQYFQDQGLDLTLRQLFYQLIKRGLHPDISAKGAGQRYYKRVGRVLNKARLNGDFPIDWMVDRTREAKAGEYEKNDTDAEECLDTCAYWVRNMPNDSVQRDHWVGQSTYFTIGVEKEALAGVFEGPCDDIGCGLFVFRGYVSISALYQWCRNYRKAFDSVPADAAPIEQAVMCYFGDHDPDGFEIPAAGLRVINKIIRFKGWTDLPPVTFRRMALTQEQIRQFNPPPFEAKKNSSRYKRYIARTGLTDAWELDALDPPELQRLIRACAKPYFDMAVHEANRELVERVRDEVWDRICDPGWRDDLIGEGRRPSQDTDFWESYAKDASENGTVIDPYEFGGEGAEDEEDEGDE